MDRASVKLEMDILLRRGLDIQKDVEMFENQVIHKNALSLARTPSYTPTQEEKGRDRHRHRGRGKTIWVGTYTLMPGQSLNARGKQF